MRVFLRSNILFVLFVILLSAPLQAETVPFHKAIELALQHSGTMAIATADEIRAHQSLQQARDLFLPQATVGSGLAATFGFPLSIEGSAPSIISLGSQQFLWNPAQREFIRAARTQWQATSFLAQDRKNQVVLETALVYSELDALTSSLKILEQQQAASSKAEQVVSDRVREGIESEVELTRARLASARGQMKMAEVQGAVDGLRTRLAQLTGLPAASIETSTESIPKLPQVNQDEDLMSKALESSSSVKVANENANAKELRAKGEHKMNYPAVDFVAQYGLFSKHNNFQEFFRKFQRNNGTVGLAIRFPFLNLSQRATAEAADAEAVIAKKQAEGVKDQVSFETLKLQRSIRQLAAAKEVARLEHELARVDVESAQARVQAGTTSLKDEAIARVHESETYVAFLDASFALDKAQMQLLSATGELQHWAALP